MRTTNSGERAPRGLPARDGARSDPPSATDQVAPYSWRSLWTARTIALVWLPIALIGVLHYATDPSLLWVHNVLRRLYYLPIIVAAFQAGLRGGLAASVVASLTYLPHAFAHIGHLAHSDPGSTDREGLEIVVYNLAGAVAGYFATAERKRRAELRVALEEQQRLQRQLVRAGRLSALGEVVAGIAHEIRNPLHALRGTAEIVDPLIAKGREERRMWEIHVAELERLDRVATRFLSFASPSRSSRHRSICARWPSGWWSSWARTRARKARADRTELPKARDGARRPRPARAGGAQHRAQRGARGGAQGAHPGERDQPGGSRPGTRCPRS